LFWLLKIAVQDDYGLAWKGFARVDSGK
jgi:hypothetical protein